MTTTTATAKAMPMAMASGSVSASESAGAAALTMEAAVLERIVALLPMDSSGHAIGGASEVLQTVAAICRALPTSGVAGAVARRVGPANRAFWQRMVLRGFDFTVHSRVTFNVRDVEDSGLYYGPDDSALLQAAYEQWAAATPDDGSRDWMLGESLAYWSQLDVFFRPAQYGFLREIQYGARGLDAWPAHEDPFTLFCDLALLKDKLAAFHGEMTTHSDRRQPLHPVLLSPYRADVSAETREPFLQHCGFAPPFWLVRADPVGSRWSGFDAEPGSDDSTTRGSSSRADQDMEEEDERLVNDEAPLPHAARALLDDFQVLAPLPHAARALLDDFQVLVRRYMDDFREVAVGRAYCRTPIFHVGRMKRSGRWLGFVGRSDDTTPLKVVWM
ncbi:hypothetical protein ATCC90586_006449 [Pythium insidiosum]|nr:hypothetical protein ATCC90586_006449 [Pythium insidiosum]